MAQQYQITIASHLDDSWSEWFAGLTIQRLPSGETLLSGELPDQAALHGILARVRDLGLALNAVAIVPHQQTESIQHER